MKTRIIAIICIIVVAFPLPAGAWSEGGHHLIAAVAFSLLSDKEKSELLEVLKEHPRFAEDFVSPEKLPNEEEETRWLVGRSGYWPDVARSQPQYNRSTWHYELGPSLIIGSKDKLAVPDRPGVLPTEANLETQELHIAQALELCRKVLADKSQPAADRAIALCWIGHLVADSHQPCHAGSLYMEGVFIESDGDRGANRILTSQKKNMHALWDQLLGPEFTLQGTRSRYAEIVTSSELTAIGEQALAKGLDPQVWLEESRQLATEHVYTPVVIESLNVVARGLVDKPEVLDLPEDYLKNAGRVAQIRAAEAGYRLAGVWKECFGEIGE
jgi:hypothetical protein